MSRRRKLVLVSGDHFKSFLTVGYKFENAVVEEGLPEDAAFVAMAYNAERDLWMLVFASPSFDEVKPGDQLPELLVKLRRTA